MIMAVITALCFTACGGGKKDKTLEDYCKDNGIIVYNLYVDDGYTGTNYNRPAFQRLLKDCENKEKYLTDNAFASRMILSFGKAEPNATYTILSSAIINSIIPYLIADKEDSIDEIAEKMDKKTDEMMEDIMNKITENKESSEEKE